MRSGQSTDDAGFLGLRGWISFQLVSFLNRQDAGATWYDPTPAAHYEACMHVL